MFDNLLFVNLFAGNLSQSVWYELNDVVVVLVGV